MLEKIKQSSLSIFNKFLSHSGSQDSLTKIIKEHQVKTPQLKNLENPYYSYSARTDDVSQRDDIVFITSRFRSGSTVLWNMFRQMEDVTAYYEPFNERRWFDSNVRGEFVDSTHIGVDDYSKEYNGLEHLDKFYDEEWIRSNLLMDENSWQPKMKAYIDELIRSAKGRPVLQFNRIDFRLPWIKKYYPNAKIIHLYRNPRDQWCSFLTDKKLMNKDDVVDTYQDNFYLDVWCNDLKKHYPFLDPKVTTHPYQRFYYLWKLSYLNGKQYADLSISYEQLASDNFSGANAISRILGLDLASVIRAQSIVNNAILKKWESYADDVWFTEIEKRCEFTFEQIFI